MMTPQSNHTGIPLHLKLFFSPEVSSKKYIMKPNITQNKIYREKVSL